MSSTITLRLLGSAAIEWDGATLGGRAAQKRRLALLSLLAMSPARCLTRDRLMAYLWPESDTQQARHLLAVAVHEIRKVLGEDVLLTRGDELELNGARVATDVERFDAACESGDLRHAVALYTGPFLDGFHVNDAPDFEHWVDGERDRLSRRHATSLESLAREHAGRGDTVGAAMQWRALAALDPYNSRIARELMLALDAAGDRAGALQLARVHTLLLQEEYGAQPDEELVALAARLKATRVQEPEIAPAQPADEPFTTTAVVASPVATPIQPPEPTRVTQPKQPTATRRMRRRSRARTLIATAIILVVTGGVAVWSFQNMTRGPANVVTPVPSIAVLPFSNLDTSPEYALFGAGISGEIALALGRLEGIRVVNGSMVSVAATDPPGEAGRELGVSYIVEGTIRTGGGRIRVQATLIEASTRRQLWTDSYDRPLQMSDKLAVQEEIAQAVVRSLELEMKGPQAREPLLKPMTENLEAYTLYRRGFEFAEQRTVPNLIRALKYFQKATATDTTYALAWASQAEVYTLLGAYDYSLLPPTEAFEKARSAAQRALKLDPDLAQAYAALGVIAFNYDRDAAAADRAFQHAFKVNRGYAPAYHWYALFLATRARFAEARAAVLKAGEMDPNSMVVRTALARPVYYERQFTRAIEMYREAVQHDSTFVPARIGLALSLAGAAHFDEAATLLESTERLLGSPQPLTQGLLGYVYGRGGHMEKARANLAALHALEKKRYIAPEYFAIVYIGLSDKDRAFDALERALSLHSGGIAYIGVEPIVDPLRNDPRFASLLQRAGL